MPQDDIGVALPDRNEMGPIAARREPNFSCMNGGRLGGKHGLELIVRIYALDHSNHETKPVTSQT